MMRGTSGLQNWVSAPLFFGVIDSFSILTALVIGACVGFGGDLSSVIEINYPFFVKFGGITFVIQIAYYWVDRSTGKNGPSLFRRSMKWPP